MQDFTDSLESLGDIQGKYPPSTLVLRAQFLYMLQDQFRDLELDYRKISKMYVAEMEKAAKLELQITDLKQGKNHKTSELRTYECWVYNPGCRADMVSKPEADAVLAALEEKHKKEVGQLLMKISELEKLVETADKLLKQKGGFTVKDITFGGVKLKDFKGGDKCRG